MYYIYLRRASRDIKKSVRVNLQDQIFFALNRCLTVELLAG